MVSTFAEDNVNFRVPRYQEMPTKLVSWRTKVDTTAGKSPHCGASKCELSIIFPINLAIERSFNLLYLTIQHV